MISNAGRIVWAVVCAAPGDHPVGEPLVDHHGAEVGAVGHRVHRQRERDALVCAQLRVDVGEPLPGGRGDRIDETRSRQLQAEHRGASADLVLPAEHGEIDDAAQQQLLRGLQDPVVPAFGQHDVLAIGACTLDQRVLEHQRGHAGRSGHGDPLPQQLVVDVVLEQPDGHRDLPFAFRADRAPHPEDRRYGLVRVGRHRDHRHTYRAQSVDEPADRRVDEAAREHETGHRREAGQLSGQGSGDDVGPVPWGDHKITLREPLEEGGQPHRADDHPRDLPRTGKDGTSRVRERRGGLRGDERRGAEPVRHLRHGGCGEQRGLGQHGGRQVRRDVGQARSHAVHRVRPHPVADHPEHGAAALDQNAEILTHRIEHLLGRARSAPDDEQYGAPQVVGRVEVERQLQAEGGLGEVAAFDDDDVRAARHGRVTVEDALHQHVVVAGVHIVEVLAGEGVGLDVALGEPETGADQLDVRIRGLGGRDERPVEGQAARVAGQHLREP